MAKERSPITVPSENEDLPDKENAPDFDEDTLRATADVYRNEGNEAFKKGDFINAIHFYTKGIKMNCNEKELKAKLHNNRAIAHFKLGNHQDSLRDAEAAIELNPTSLKAIVRGATACVELKRFVEVITWCDKGLAIDKNNLDLKIAKEVGDKHGEGKAYGNLGNAYRFLGDFKKAIEYHNLHLKIAKEVGDKHGGGNAYGNLGNAYYSLGDIKKALEYPNLNLKIAKEVGDKHETNNIVVMAMEFEAKHRECVRVLTYTNNDHVKVKLYVSSGKSGIPETLKAAAKDFFKEMDVKLEWFDLYKDADEILKIRPLEYSFGMQQALNDSQVNEMNKIISENLHVLVRHRNITAVQPSLKITNSKQTGIPCITFYVLCKGVIPDGECSFPLTLGSYPVDVVDGIWFRTDDPWPPNEAQERNEVLRLGASIGVQGEDAAGTLGAIVKDGKTFYALSCHHVMRHSTKSEIIHPALNDHLNYLNYHLQQYGLRIKHIIYRESCHRLADKFLFSHIAGLEELLNKFQELKRIKENHQHHARVTKRKLEALELHERAFEKGLTPPRVIAKYSVGISGNVTWNDGQQYYVDAALAELTPEEVDSLRQSQTAEMIGTGDHPSGECSSRLQASRELCKSGRTTGFTNSGRHVQPSMFLNASLYEVNAQNEGLVSVLKRVRLCQSCKERSGIGEQLESTASDCDSCKIDTASLRDSLWLKNCLCIDHPFGLGYAKVFATEGDSGAVLFERDEDRNLEAFGIIFGEHRNSYKLCALATPMQIALESLSRKISKDTNLRLLSNYE